MRRIALLAVALLAAVSPAAPAEGSAERFVEDLVEGLVEGLEANRGESWAGDGIAIRGSGRVISEIRDVRGFTSVELKGIGDLLIVRGRSERLEVEAEDNILDVIITEVAGGVLTIAYRRGGRPVNLRPTRPVRFTLTVRDVARIATFGSGSVSSSGLSGSLEVATFGSGGVRLASALLDELTVSIAGSGSVEVEGSAEALHVSIAASGSCRAARMASRTAEVRIAGSGSVIIGPSERLDVSILGSGSVSYYGQPNLSSQVLGSGEVRSLGSGF